MGHGDMQVGFAWESAGGSSRRRIERRAGADHLRAGAGGGGLCPPGIGQATDRAAGSRGGTIAPDTVHAFGHEAALPETVWKTPQAAARSQAGPSWIATTTSPTHRPSQGASGRAVPPVWRSFAVLRPDTHPLYRRHSADPAGGDRAYDPPRLVSHVPKALRADGSRGPVGRDPGQPRAWCSRLGCTTAWAIRSRRSWRSSTSTCR